MENRKLWILIMALILLTGLGLAGCSSSGYSQKPYVAFVVKSTVSAFWKSVYAGANAASAEYNVDISFEGPAYEEDSDTQNTYVHEALEEGADIIVLSATDYEANASAVEEAVGKGIQVVVIDSNVNSSQISCYIGTDNFEAGKMAAKAALQSKDEKLQIGVVNYGIKSFNGQERERGLREALGHDSRVESITTINVVSTKEEAEEGTLELLKEHPEINVIVTFNEWTSLGVGAAIQKLGLAESTHVVAFDSNVVSVGMLETGEVDALIVQNPYAMGYLGVENAYNLIYGKKVDSQFDTSTTLINRNNMYTEECQKILFSFTQ